MATAFSPALHPDALLARLDRSTLEAFVAAAIDMLDTLDGDPDLEDDDPAGQNDEDERNTCFHFLVGYEGPGCPISDPDGEVFPGHPTLAM